MRKLSGNPSPPQWGQPYRGPGRPSFFFVFPLLALPLTYRPYPPYDIVNSIILKRMKAKETQKKRRVGNEMKGIPLQWATRVWGVVQCVWKAKTKGNDFIGRLSVVISHIVFRRKTYSIKNSSRGKKSADEYNSPRPSVGRPAAPFDQGSPNKGNFEPSAPSSVGATIAHSLGAHNSCCAFQGPRYLLPHWSAPHLLCS